MSTLHKVSWHLAPLALLLALPACDERSPSAPPSGTIPAGLRVLAGDGQQTVAGATLPDELIVTAVDAVDRPLPGVPVQFAVVAGGGHVAQEVTADEHGFARTRWTLGTVAADSQVVEARSAGVPSLRLRARATPGPASSATMAGGSAVGPVGAPLADSLAVAVKDRFGNPVERVEVAWEVAAGGGTVSPARSFTGADGFTKAQWTLGPRADAAQAVRARVAGFDPLSFTASAVTRGAPLQLARRGGDGQRGSAGGLLADPLEVVLRMPDGRPVPGATVTWSASLDAGTLAPALSRTDADGAASAVWRLGTAAGLVQATATVDEGTLVFTALTESAPAAEMVLLAGDGGAGAVGAPLADSLAVRVRDRYGNPVAGVEVAWDATDGGGSLHPARGPTDAAGIARAQWVLGPRVDAPQAARARLAGLSPVAFHASARTDGADLRLARRGGDGQRGTVGAVLEDSLRVVLRMPDGRPVAGALVRWNVPAEAGMVTPAIARTDMGGGASAVWRLGTLPGVVQATATVDGGTLVFTALAEVAAPARMVAIGGSTAGPVAAPLADSLAVRVKDEYGNPVAWAEVAWVTESGGGEVRPARGHTDAQGVARAQWTLGPYVGPPGQAASATVAGLPPVVFSATATTRGVSLQFTRISGYAQTAEVGSTLADSLVVQLRTQTGVPVQGAAVAWTAATGSGQVSPAAGRTDAQGIARTAWTLGTTAGTARATATLDGLAVVFYATARRGPPAALHVAGGDRQTGTRGTRLPDLLRVRVTDRYGNPVPGVTVRWSVRGGGGLLEKDTAITASDGSARAAWAVGFTPGENAAAASVDGAGEVRFTATGTAGRHVLGGWTQDVRTWRIGPSRWGLQARVDTWLTDEQGHRVVGAHAALELNGRPVPWPAPASPWQSRPSLQLDTTFNPLELPLPFLTARYEGEKLHLPVLRLRDMYRMEVTLPRNSLRYFVDETIHVGLRLTYLYPADVPAGWEPVLPVRFRDYDGWAAETDTRAGANWPLASALSWEWLQVCLIPPVLDSPCTAIRIFVSERPR